MLSKDNADLIFLGISSYSGFVVYLILSFLFVPEKISIPVSIIFVVLILGLFIYYSVSVNFFFKKTKPVSPDSTPDNYVKNDYETSANQDNDISPTGPFLVLYTISIVIVVLGSYTNRELFIPWEQIGPLQIIQLASAMLISFFFPFMQ